MKIIEPSAALRNIESSMKWRAWKQGVARGGGIENVYIYIASYNFSISRVSPRRRKSKYRTVVCTYAGHSSLFLIPLFHTFFQFRFRGTTLDESICRIDLVTMTRTILIHESGKSLFYLEVTDFSLSLSF